MLASDFLFSAEVVARVEATLLWLIYLDRVTPLDVWVASCEHNIFDSVASSVPFVGPTYLARGDLTEISRDPAAGNSLYC